PCCSVVLLYREPQSPWPPHLSAVPGRPCDRIRPPVRRLVQWSPPHDAIDGDPVDHEQLPRAQHESFAALPDRPSGASPIASGCRNRTSVSSISISLTAIAGGKASTPTRSPNTVSPADRISWSDVPSLS